MTTSTPSLALATAQEDAKHLSSVTNGFTYVYQIGPGGFAVSNHHLPVGVLVARYFRGESCSELVDKVEASLARQRADNSAGSLRLAFLEATEELGIIRNGQLFNDLWQWLKGS